MHFAWPCGAMIPTYSEQVLKVALDGGTRPGDTLQIHPHFLSLMGDGHLDGGTLYPGQPCQFC